MKARTTAGWLMAGATVAALAFAGCSRESEKPAAAPKAAQVEARYHCPMHPSVVSDKPGDCPICGMRLVAIEKGDTSTREPTPAASETNGVPGLAPVTIGDAARERMGLSFSTVGRRALARTIRTSGRIVPDESRLHRVTTKVEGWVDALYVNADGQSVKAGQPLLALYSPQLVSAQEEYLAARKATAPGSEALVKSARLRLEGWDIGADQLARMEQSGQAQRALVLESPAGGIVMEKLVLAGQKVSPGDALMVVADLGVVWGEADIFPGDLAFVRVGTQMELSLPYTSGRAYAGTVSYVSPTIDATTRSAVARIEIPNPQGLLKPGMYGDAVLTVPLGDVLAVPESAVMRTGKHAYAFRDDGAGRLTPVEVTLGPRSDGYFEIRAGLREGDRVVTAANFLVDSESSLQAALQAVGR